MQSMVSGRVLILQKLQKKFDSAFGLVVESENKFKSKSMFKTCCPYLIDASFQTSSTDCRKGKRDESTKIFCDDTPPAAIFALLEQSGAQLLVYKGERSP